jgi:hypothetical protein
MNIPITIDKRFDERYMEDSGYLLCFGDAKTYCHRRYDIKDLKRAGHLRFNFSGSVTRLDILPV